MIRSLLSQKIFEILVLEFQVVVTSYVTNHFPQLNLYLLYEELELRSCL